MLKTVIFHPEVFHLTDKTIVLLLQLEPLMQTFTTAVLSVAPILQRPSLLLQLEYELFRDALQSAIEFSDWQ